MKKFLSVLLALSLLLVMFSMTGFAATGDTYLEFNWIEQGDITDVADVSESYDYDIVLTLNMLHNPGTATLGGFIEYNHNDVEIVPMTGFDAEDQLWKGLRAKSYGYCEFAPNFQSELDRGYFTAAKTSNETRLGNLFHVMFKIKTSAMKATTISFTPDANNCVDVANVKVPFNQASYSVTFNLNGYVPSVNHTLNFDPNTTDVVTGMPGDMSLEAGTAVDLPILGEPARDGYTFLGWSEDGTTVVATYAMASEDDTLYAVWEENTSEVVITPPTSTKEGLKEIRGHSGNFIRNEAIPMLPHFGTIRGLQVPTGATTGDAATTVRLILGINSLEYLRAGFIVAAQSNLNKDGYTFGDEYTKAILASTVYKTLTTGGKTYDAKDFGAEYLVVVEIANFPMAAYNYGVRFQGFAVTQDGEYHFDTKTVTTVTTLING